MEYIIVAIWIIFCAVTGLFLVLGLRYLAQQKALFYGRLVFGNKRLLVNQDQKNHPCEEVDITDCPQLYCTKKYEGML